MTADVTGGVQETADRYRDYWKDKSDWYWYWRLVQEVVELGLCMAGLHDDSSEHEKIQIASICINWLRK